MLTKSHLTGVVFRVMVREGDVVEKDQVVALLEAMKMEVAVQAPTAGTVASIAVNEGDPIAEGDTILAIQEA